MAHGGPWRFLKFPVAALLVAVAGLLWYPRWVVSRGGLVPLAAFWAARAKASRPRQDAPPPAPTPAPARASRKVVERQAADGRTERLTWDETGALEEYELFEGRYEWRWGKGAAHAYEIRWSRHGFKAHERGAPPAALPPEVDVAEAAPGPGEAIVRRFAESIGKQVGPEYFAANYTLVPESYRLDDRRGSIRVGLPEDISRQITLAYAYGPARRLDAESLVTISYRYCAKCPAAEALASGEFEGQVADLRRGRVVEPVLTREQALAAAGKVAQFKEAPATDLQLRQNGWIWRVMSLERTVLLDAVTGAVLDSFENGDSGRSVRRSLGHSEPARSDCAGPRPAIRGKGRWLPYSTGIGRGGRQLQPAVAVLAAFALAWYPTGLSRSLISRKRLVIPL